MCLGTRTGAGFGVPACALVCSSHTHARTHIYISCSFALRAPSHAHALAYPPLSRVRACASSARTQAHARPKAPPLVHICVCALRTRARTSRTLDSRKHLRVRTPHTYHCTPKQLCSSCASPPARDRHTCTISCTSFLPWCARAFPYLSAHRAYAAHAGAPRSYLFLCASACPFILTHPRLPPYYTRTRTPTIGRIKL